jgi:hypothetical protein
MDMADMAISPPPPLSSPLMVGIGMVMAVVEVPRAAAVVAGFVGMSMDSMMVWSVPLDTTVVSEQALGAGAQGYNRRRFRVDLSLFFC